MTASLKPLPSADCVAVLETHKPADKQKTDFFGTENNLSLYEACVPEAPCSRREEGHRGCFHNIEDIELKFMLQLLF